MIQTIQGREVYVVDIDKIPGLPITWERPGEKLYAQALQDAIETGVIREAGKYGIHIPSVAHLNLAGTGITYEIFKILENGEIEVAEPPETE